MTAAASSILFQLSAQRPTWSVKQLGRIRTLFDVETRLERGGAWGRLCAIGGGGAEGRTGVWGRGGVPSRGVSGRTHAVPTGSSCDSPWASLGRDLTRGWAPWGRLSRARAAKRERRPRRTVYAPVHVRARGGGGAVHPVNWPGVEFWLEANRPGRAKRTAGRSDYHELRF